IVVGRVSTIAAEVEAAVIVRTEVAVTGELDVAVDAHLIRSIRARAEPDRNDVRRIRVERRRSGRQQVAVDIVEEQFPSWGQVAACLVFAVDVSGVEDTALARLRSELELEAVEDRGDVVEGPVGLTNNAIGHAIVAQKLVREAAIESGVGDNVAAIIC